MNQEVVLNGCVIAYSYDKLSKKCRSCMNKDYCDKKSKEKLGVLSSPVISDPAAITSKDDEFVNAVNKLAFAQKNFGVSAEKAASAFSKMAAAAKKYTGGNNI